MPGTRTARPSYRGAPCVSPGSRPGSTGDIRAPMAQHARFRFGVQASAPSRATEWVELARQVEDLGLLARSSMPDHFGDQLAPCPALMAAADATTTCASARLVFDNDYKHPVVLAKELATIDLLSGGRLELGIGAGWMTTDYEQSGIPYDRAGVRVDRMEEGLAVIKGRCRPTARSRFAGEHYTITGLDGLPKPVQRPRRRSSSAAAASACWRSPPARPTSSASTRTCAAGAIGPEAARVDDTPTRSTRRSAGSRGRRRRPLRRHSS